MIRNAMRLAVLALVVACALPAEADYEEGRQAWDAGRPDEALAQWRTAADEGDRRAMLALGRLYAQGLGAPQDYVEAHKWFNLAASRGEAAAVEERDGLAAKMTPQQVGAAQAQARSWQPGGGVAAGAAGSAGSPGGTAPDRVAPVALHRAAQAGDVTGLQAALSAGMDVDARDGRGWTALMHAVNEGYPLLVEMLLAAGADPDPRAPDGATALFMAVAHRHKEIIEQLMEVGADPTVKGPKGKTVVDVVRMRYGDAAEATENGEPAAVVAWLEAGRLAELRRADDEAFERAKSEGTVSAFDGYLSLCDEWCGHGEEARRLREAERKAREEEGRRLARKWPAGTKFRDCAECPELVVVPPGSFLMGSPESEEGRRDNEGPVHRVEIGRTFAVGVYEVTFGEWDACVSGGGCGGYRPGDEGWGRGNRPVVNVSFRDARGYVAWLSRKTGKEYRLLSESEWEYVARAGARTRYWWGDEVGRDRANCNGCGSRWDNDRTAPVGSFPANGFGLHDVHGNVFEWVEDCWNGSYYGAPVDGSAWESGNCESRTLRDGSWKFDPQVLRSAFRFVNPAGGRYNGVGFRVARTLD